MKKIPKDLCTQISPFLRTISGHRHPAACYMWLFPFLYYHRHNCRSRCKGQLSDWPLLSNMTEHFGMPRNDGHCLWSATAWGCSIYSVLDLQIANSYLKRFSSLLTKIMHIRFLYRLTSASSKKEIWCFCENFLLESYAKRKKTRKTLINFLLSYIEL